MELLDNGGRCPAINGEEVQLDKVVRFEEGPILAIGYQQKPRSTIPTQIESAGIIALFTRDGAGKELNSSRYQIGLHRGLGEQLHYILLDYDSRPELQVRKVVSLLEEDKLITSKQREKAYDELGLREELYKRSVKEGRVF